MLEFSQQPPLLVFADDWGRHPSSCQHLMRHLAIRRDVRWVNTIGMRSPKIDLATVARGAEKIGGWIKGQCVNDRRMPQRLSVHNPWMWPWMTGWGSRRLNRSLLARQLLRVVEECGTPPVAVTTLPITADVMDDLCVQRWVYYCVDDFSNWPGLDSTSMDKMERSVVDRADVLIAASETLRERLASMGRESHLLTHGVDIDHWQIKKKPCSDNEPGVFSAQRPASHSDVRVKMPFPTPERPLIVFWGLIDRRLDLEFVRATARSLERGAVLLVGPEQNADPELDTIERVVRCAAVSYDELPLLAREADVLAMPYKNLAVTRAMQPLKLKEYLATGKPVVARDLPAVREWADCLDLADTPEKFAEAVAKRLANGLPECQRQARQRLADESWEVKARRFEELIETVEESWVRIQDSGNGAYRTAGLELDAQDRLGTGLSSPDTREFCESPAVGTGAVCRPSTASPAAIVPGVRAGSALPIFHLRTVIGRGGGPEKTLLASARHIGDAYDLRLIYVRPADDRQYDMPARAARAGVNLVDIPERNGWDLRTVARLAREIKNSRPALLHAHDHKTNVLALALGRMFRLPVLTTMHGNVTRGGRLEFYYRLERPALRRMDRVIAVSPDLVKYAVEIGVPRERIRLVENAIDLEQFTRRSSADEAKRRLGLSPNRLLVGAVGRLSEEKGFDRLIVAFGKLVARQMDMVLLGEGPQRAALERLIAERGLEERVRLLGYQTDTVAWFEAMDLFVLSSLREGLPNVVLEAMSLEVPVVATRIAGVPRLVQDGENGLLVEPDDVDGLCRAIGRLADDAKSRSRLAAAARKAIETGYSFEQRMAKIRAIYDEVLRERDASASL